MNVFKIIFRSAYRKALKPLYRRFNEIDEEIKYISNFVPLYLEYKNKNSNKRENVIYTCIAGNYDELRQHAYINFDYDYICFTDNEKLLKFEEFGIWKIRPLEYTKLDNARNNRWHKTHPHIILPNYNKSIYVDANINIISDYLFSVLEMENKHKIKIPVHPDKNCIYREIKTVLKFKRDTKEAVEKVNKLLKNENFPKNYGLNENCVIYREHNDEKVIKIMNSWWEMIEHYSRRDQLSLSYILWKNGIRPEDIGIPNTRTSINNVSYKCYQHKR